MEELRIAVIDLVERARPLCQPGTFLAEVGQFPEGEMHQLVLEMILAGTDTSSVTMFYLILAARDDEELEKALREEAAAGKLTNERRLKV